MSDNTKLQFLCDHYKDTFTQLKEYLKQRDKLFIIILIFIALILFQVYSPNKSGELMLQFISQKLGVTSQFDLTFLTSMIWFSLFTSVLRYFQTVILIERQYKYLHMMEGEISSNYDNKIFTRESKAYLNDYPLFSEWASAIYTLIFPILLIFVLWLKISTEVPDIRNVPIFSGVDIVFFALIVFSTILYLYHRYFKKQ